MRRVEQLIDIARKLSQNTRYDENSGVPQDVFVQYLNNAQDSLVMEIQNLKTKYFFKTQIVDVVAGQEFYPYPDDCYPHHLDTIQWTSSPTGTYWQRLYKTTQKEKITIQPGYPFAYIPLEKTYGLNPPITAGKLYVSYIRYPYRLQKRSGKISSVNISSGNLTYMTLDIDDSSFDLSELNSSTYMCVVDKFGDIKVKNLLYDCVSDMGAVTLDPFALGTQTLEAGDYVCVGENVVNKSELPTICEGYLIKHMVYEAKYGDSSSWTPAAVQDMQAYFAKLSNTFATLSDDITDVPITNLDYIGW